MSAVPFRSYVALLLLALLLKLVMVKLLYLGAIHSQVQLVWGGEQRWPLPSYKAPLSKAQGVCLPHNRLMSFFLLSFILWV